MTLSLGKRRPKRANENRAAFEPGKIILYNRNKVSSEGIVDREARWIARIAAGDQDAFECIWNTYRNRVYSYLYPRLRDKDAVEEVTLDVFLAIWRNAASFRGESRPSSWIFGIAFHRCLAWQKRDRGFMASMDSALPVDPGQGPEKRLIGRDLCRSALEKLSENHRTVIELAFVHGFSCKEIAGIMGCPTNTVKTRMHYAKEKLRAHLSKNPPQKPNGEPS